MSKRGPMSETFHGGYMDGEVLTDPAPYADSSKLWIPIWHRQIPLPLGVNVLELPDGIYGQLCREYKALHGHPVNKMLYVRGSDGDWYVDDPKPDRCEECEKQYPYLLAEDSAKNFPR